MPGSPAYAQGEGCTQTPEPAQHDFEIRSGTCHCQCTVNKIRSGTCQCTLTSITFGKCTQVVSKNNGALLVVLLLVAVEFLPGYRPAGTRVASMHSTGRRGPGIDKGVMQRKAAKVKRVTSESRGVMRSQPRVTTHRDGLQVIPYEYYYYYYPRTPALDPDGDFRSAKLGRKGRLTSFKRSFMCCHDGEVNRCTWNLSSTDAKFNTNTNSDTASAEEFHRARTRVPGARVGILGIPTRVPGYQLVVTD
eukprot:2559074-Rhodomonas_salina.1